MQIFASGKITFLGAPSRDAINRAFRYVYPKILKYRPINITLPFPAPTSAPQFGAAGAPPDAVKEEFTVEEVISASHFAPPPPLEATGGAVKIERDGGIKAEKRT